MARKPYQAAEPPAETAPAETPVDSPPVEQPPVEQPPAVDPPPTTEPPTAEPPTAEPPTAEQRARRALAAVASPAGRAWLAQELAAAEREEQRGPGGAGWQYNESKRAEITERAEFLRALTEVVVQVTRAFAE